MRTTTAVESGAESGAQKDLLPYFHISYLGRRYKIFKREPHRNAPFYVKVMRRGKTYRRCLEVNVQDQAALKAREIIDLVLHDDVATLEAMKLRGAPKPITPAAYTTIGDLSRAYEAKAGVFIKPATVRVNLNSLRLVVREGLGKPKLEDARVDEQKLTVLTGSLVAKFEEQRLRAAGPKEEDRQRALVTINAYMRFTRSIFKDKFRKMYVRDYGLALPDLTGFLEEELHQPARMVKEPAPKELVARTFEESKKLRETDRDAYMAFLLSACSLRRSEARNSCWSWVQWDQRSIRVPRESKSKVIRIVPLPASVVAELQEYRNSLGERPAWDREFILPTGLKGNGGPNVKSRAQSVLERVDAWMRNLGWTTRHTVHELRAHYLRELRKAYGLEVAGEVGGHSDLRVTRTHYTGILDVSGVDVKLPLPAL